MYVLGIETSCDETSVAIVKQGDMLEKRICSLLISSQDHAAYGGVIPEFAARSHLEVLPLMTKRALEEADLSASHLSSLAVTGGPGLIGGLLVGVMYCKGLSLSLGKPFFMVDHLEGHILTPRLSHQVSFPYLMLLVSGGHCQILDVQELGQYKILSQTLDDAVGEVFDKTARLLDLPYPGGPPLEALAKQGDPHRFPFPLPMRGRDDMSFSGLKNAVRLLIQKHAPLCDQDRADMAASFQMAIANALIRALTRTLVKTDAKTLVTAGGVASNQFLREHLLRFSVRNEMDFFCPPPHLCADNAAMIAWTGLEYLGRFSKMDTVPYPRSCIFDSLKNSCQV